MTPEGVVIENLFSIADKDGNDVPFILNTAQRRVDAELSGRDVIPKARQEGVSSYVLARWTVACLSKRNSRAVVISHDTESTQRMLAKVHYYLKNMKGPKPVIKNLSKNEITFPKTNSVFYIGTAGSRAFGRGDTITHLHGSEVAYWPDPKKLLSGLFQAVPLSGEIVLESTGNGVGNYYHKTCKRASEKNSRYNCIFLPWNDFPEYCLQMDRESEKALMDNLIEEYEEPFLVEHFKLTPGQIAWRRMKLEELDFDIDLFKQEYPLTLDECFMSTGSSIFHKVHFAPMPEWRRTGARIFEMGGHPKAGKVYTLGCDVSGGVGKDNAVMEVIDAQAMEQVAEWVSNKTAPDILASHIAELGARYNNAYLAVESNNHGIVTLKCLLDLYPKHLIVRGERTDTILDYGMRTTQQTKPMMIGMLRQALARGMLLHSPELRDELSTFVETETGQLEAEEGCYDDRVIALALAVFIAPRAVMLRVPLPGHINREPDPFSLEGILNGLRHGKEGDYPISSGVGVLV